MLGEYKNWEQSGTICSLQLFYHFRKALDLRYFRIWQSESLRILICVGSIYKVIGSWQERGQEKNSQSMWLKHVLMKRYVMATQCPWLSKCHRWSIRILLTEICSTQKCALFKSFYCCGQRRILTPLDSRDMVLESRKITKPRTFKKR